MEEDKPDPSVEVSQWLREVGARRWPRPQPVRDSEVVEPPRPSSPVLRRTLLLGLLLVACLQYVYASTTAEILSLPSLIVFIFTSAPG
jgi:hypothetical protein